MEIMCRPQNGNQNIIVYRNYHAFKKYFVETKSYPTNMIRTKWASNLNAYGAYSYTAVETEMYNFSYLVKSRNSKVFSRENTWR
jgi:hypothetical protein